MLLDICFGLLVSRAVNSVFPFWPFSASPALRQFDSAQGQAGIGDALARPEMSQNYLTGLPARDMRFDA